MHLFVSNLLFMIIQISLQSNHTRFHAIRHQIRYQLTPIIIPHCLILILLTYLSSTKHLMHSIYINLCLFIMGSLASAITLIHCSCLLLRPSNSTSQIFIATSQIFIAHHYWLMVRNFGILSVSCLWVGDVLWFWVPKWNKFQQKTHHKCKGSDSYIVIHKLTEISHCWMVKPLS